MGNSESSTYPPGGLEREREKHAHDIKVMEQALMQDVFYKDVFSGRIPQGPPKQGMVQTPEGIISSFIGRRLVTDQWMWAIVHRQWVWQLADWLGARKVLEVMAGRGWLAKALSDEGIQVTASDSKAYYNKIPQPLPDLFPVQRATAKRSLEILGDWADVLLCSWPPYDSADLEDAVKLWRGRPMVYIGEQEGGCNATDGFFNLFVSDEFDDQPVNSFSSWPGINDRVMTGHILSA